MPTGGNNQIDSKLITWNKENQGEFPFLLLFWHKWLQLWGKLINLWNTSGYCKSWGKQISLKLGRGCTLDSFLILPLTSACVLFLWHCACHLIRPQTTTPLWAFQGYPKQRICYWCEELGRDIVSGKQCFLGGMSNWRSLLTGLGSGVLTGKRQMLVHGCH